MFQINAIEQMIGSTALAPEKERGKKENWIVKENEKDVLSLFIQWGKAYLLALA
jgi:hypothetical protein